MILSLILLMNSVDKIIKLVDEIIDEIIDYEIKERKRDYMDAEIISERESR